MGGGWQLFPFLAVQISPMILQGPQPCVLIFIILDGFVWTGGHSGPRNIKPPKQKNPTVPANSMAAWHVAGGTCMLEVSLHFKRLIWRLVIESMVCLCIGNLSFSKLDRPPCFQEPRVIFQVHGSFVFWGLSAICQLGPSPLSWL
jgi:hypothetical protein